MLVVPTRLVALVGVSPWVDLISQSKKSGDIKQITTKQFQGKIFMKGSRFCAQDYYLHMLTKFLKKNTLHVDNSYFNCYRMLLAIRLAF